MTVLDKATQYVVEQDYWGYTFEEHKVWSDLVRHRRRQLGTFACREYWEGFEAIGLRDDRVPFLSEISERLHRQTGWRAIPVSGFLPADVFFEMLAARMFPTTVWLRDRDSIEYTPEPDIFHDVFGHLPLLAHRRLANFVERYGKVCSKIEQPEVLECLGRLFWYTVEFGLMLQQGELRAYGGGILSSPLESKNILEDACEIQPFKLARVLQTPVKVDEVHKVLFVIESFEQIHEAMDEATKSL